MAPTRRHLAARGQTRPRLFDLHIKRPDLLYHEVTDLDERLGAAIPPL